MKYLIVIEQAATGYPRTRPIFQAALPRAAREPKPNEK